MNSTKKNTIEIEQNFWEDELQDERFSIGAFEVCHVLEDNKTGKSDWITISTEVESPNMSKDISVHIKPNGLIGFSCTTATREFFREDLTLEEITEALDVLSAIKLLNRQK